VDSDYRGEIRVIVANLGAEPVTLHRGDRLAQLVFAPVVQARFERVDDLPPSSRNAGGFGSTGKS
jgi:dUTP pyrophosphatase